MPNTQQKNIEVGKTIKITNMGNLSKIFVFKFIFVLLIMFPSVNTFAQEAEKFDYAEIIIKQKNSGEFLSINLNSISSTADKAEISTVLSKLKSTSAILKYMNPNNWEFVDRTTVLWGADAWSNFIFKKRKG